MKKFLKNEQGEFAIDAIFGITFFMITLIAIMFMTLIIRVQSNIQYAIGQTAKEISGYYYIANKIGLAQVTAGSSSEKIDADNVVENVLNFSSSTNTTINGFKDFSGLNEENIKKNAGNLEASINDFKAMKTSIESLDANSISQVLSLFAKTASNNVVSTLIAPAVCNALMPKYLSSSKYSNMKDYYTAVGINSDSVSFKGSQFLADRRSIKIQITYDLDVSKYTLGFVKTPMTFRQVASTAAWVRPDGANLAALNMKEMGYSE